MNRYRLPSCIYYTIFIVGLMIGIFLLVVNSAYSHDWYPESCCSGQDCGPIASEDLRFEDKGVRVPSGELIPYDDPRIKQTPANQEGDHWCYYQDTWQQDSRTICLYLAPRGF